MIPGFVAASAEVTADQAVYWYRRGNTAKARAKEAKFFAIEHKMERAALKMMSAAGAGGREQLPDLRREFRRGGSPSSGSES